MSVQHVCDRCLCRRSLVFLSESTICRDCCLFAMATYQNRVREVDQSTLGFDMDPDDCTFSSSSCLFSGDEELFERIHPVVVGPKVDPNGISNYPCRLQWVCDDCLITDDYDICSKCCRYMTDVSVEEEPTRRTAASQAWCLFCVDDAVDFAFIMDNDAQHAHVRYFNWKHK